MVRDGGQNLKFLSHNATFSTRSTERQILSVCNTIFTCVFTIEMAMKAVANGFVLGHNNYFSDNWNRLDGTLVIISLIDGAITMFAGI